jgi:hypothetical protein
MLLQDVCASRVCRREPDLGPTHHAQCPPAASGAVPHQELLFPRHVLLGLLTAIYTCLQQVGSRWWGLLLLGHCAKEGKGVVSQGAWGRWCSEYTCVRQVGR